MVASDPDGPMVSPVHTRFRVKLGGLNTLLILLTTLVGSVILVSSYKDGVVKAETDYEDKTRADLRSLDLNGSLILDDIEALRQRIDRRGCNKHPLLNKIYSDFQMEMKPICSANERNARILKKVEAQVRMKRASIPKVAEKPAIKETPALPGSPKRDALPASNSPYVLDIFWCRSVDGSSSEDATNQKIASHMFNALRNTEVVKRLRVREMPTSRLFDNYYQYYGRGVNARMSDHDAAVLNVIKEILRSNGIEIRLNKYDLPQDYYLSIFACYNARTFQ